ncbi:hypothetical protein [Pseudoalteromonas ulvae]|uniref:Uncharacterized protein n=1 Tax=Pseudoalteromonas ulvae TaxID=107327 RepID=A0A244CUL0_PSEDV|nr:hypothetical protein [Pseudoalteromonas ulvae]OUL59297.1 hypothetical protein B1199_03235 [Pseudoalteromonas ulvae]
MATTTVYDWIIVSIYDRYDKNDDNTFVGKVLYGFVLDDQTYRFAPNDYVTTSLIEKCDLNRGIIETHSGSVYVLQGTGTDAAIDFRDFELLQMGYSPQQISKFNLEPSSYYH